jgi:DNA-binding GntR family transcriptional regulator
MKIDRPLEIKSVEDAAYQAVRDGILSSDLLPGQHLHLGDLAEQLGVSTMPVRSAIRRLAVEGLVKLLPRRGAIVSELSMADFEEIHDLRVALEATIVGVAVLRVTEDDIDVLRAALAEYDKPHTTEDYQSIEWDAFLTFYQAANRERTLQLIIEYAQLTDRYTRLAPDAYFDLPRARSTLARLVDACEARDRIAAKDAVVESLNRALVTVRTALSASEELGAQA